MFFRQFSPGPSRGGPGPRVGNKRGTQVKDFLGNALFLLDHILKFTIKTLILGGNALLYIVENKIFDGKSFNLTVKIKLRRPRNVPQGKLKDKEKCIIYISPDL